MVVMKFGGTSVKDPEAIQRLARIVAREQATSGVPVVVVSAMSGITDQLLDAVAAVEHGDDATASRKVAVMRDRHRAAAEALLANYRSNPKGERAPDSLYYLGQSLMQLNQAGQACKAYAELEAVYGAQVRAELKRVLPAAKTDARCS